MSEIEPKPALTGIEKGGIIVEESIPSNHDTVHTLAGRSPADGPRRSPSRQGFCGTAEAVFREVKSQQSWAFWGVTCEGLLPLFSSYLVQFLYIISWRRSKNTPKPPNLVHPESCTFLQIHYTNKEHVKQEHVCYELQSRFIHPANIFHTSFHQL